MLSIIRHDRMSRNYMINPEGAKISKLDEYIDTTSHVPPLESKVLGKEYTEISGASSLLNIYTA